MSNHGFDFFAFTETQKMTPEMQEKLKDSQLVAQFVKSMPETMEIIEWYQPPCDRWERFRRSAGEN